MCECLAQQQISLRSRTRLLICATVMLCSALTGACLSAAAEEPSLRVFCAGGFKPIAKALAPLFKRASGYELVVTYDASGAIQTRLAEGQKADMIILNRARIGPKGVPGELPGSVTDVAISRSAIAVRAGAKAPDISTVAGFRKAMLDARSVSYTDPAIGGSTGVLTVRIFERLGIAEAMKGKAVLASQVAEGPGNLVAEGKAEIGINQLSELAVIPGIQIVGPLPPELDEPFVFTASIQSDAREPKVAKAFIDFLGTPEALSAIRAGGMVPATNSSRAR
jgi:molybdate transport system substrate-binding protein